jgi:hypothetical protein
MEGWYAQKHPDEDFAETFAVWMTPRSNWRKRYKGWGAMAKLKYMDRIAKKFGNAEPLKPLGHTDITVEEMEDTVEQFYESHAFEQRDAGELLLDTDLQDIFNVSPRKRKGVRPAQEFLRENRKLIVDKIGYWSGVQRPLVRNLVESIEKRAGELNLRVELSCEKQALAEIIVFITALAMNYLTRGKFVQA